MRCTRARSARCEPVSVPPEPADQAGKRDGRGGSGELSAASAERWEDWQDRTADDAGQSQSSEIRERDMYRRRRVMDTARLLPMLGSVLFLLPMLYASGSGTARGVVYLFVVWFCLIVAAVIIERRLSEPLRKADRAQAAPVGDVGTAER